jgi:hypothetical protein
MASRARARVELIWSPELLRMVVSRRGVATREAELHEALALHLPLHVVKVLVWSREGGTKQSNQAHQLLELLQQSLADSLTRRGRPCTSTRYGSEVPLCSLFRGGVQALGRIAILQVLLACAHLALSHGFAHGDLELRNVLVRRSSALEHQRLAYVLPDGRVILVRTRGLVLVLCDLGLSSAGLCGEELRIRSLDDAARFARVLGIALGVSELLELSDSLHSATRTYGGELTWEVVASWPLARAGPAERSRAARWLRMGDRGEATVLRVGLGRV